MNRIYQGRVTKVEISDGNGGWKTFDEDPKRAKEKWQEALWRHHELFQDAVNYYSLALAAMAAGLQPDSNSKESTAALAWREQVRELWLQARRKAKLFSGPHDRLAKWLDVDPEEVDAHKAFDSCAAALLKDSPASKEALAKALLQILKDADVSDLNQFCVSRLPFLCTAHGQLNATPKDVAIEQETKMLAMVREVHDASLDQLTDVAEKLELGHFVTQMPTKDIKGAEARKEAERLFESASKKAKKLAIVADRFCKQLDQLDDKLVLPRLGRKPKGAYPLAVVLKLFPVQETWEAFKSATDGLRKKAEKAKDVPVGIVDDFISEARTNADLPVFDYFTNRVFLREPKNNNRAVWFEFDLAAFIEAIKTPHRYFQDTLAREKAAEALRKKKQAMEGRGGEVDNEGEDDEGAGIGFEEDKRIALLRKLVTDTLGYIAEAEISGEDAGPIEYTIQERTLRGFDEIREKWRKLAEKNQVTQKELLRVLAEQQTKQRDDFGSAPLYRELAKPEFHPIWRDAGTEEWHAADPLKAWRIYKELCFELKDKERPIRFTPAHAEHSPRYFIIPKQGRFGSKHQSAELAFICGMALNSAAGLEATNVRITYSAPRLKRDDIRSDGDGNLSKAPWLQPMMLALGMDTPPETVNFANCRITLQPSSETNIQLGFPVEVSTDNIRASVSHEALWKKQFNLHPDGGSFYNASLRWPHEKQLAKPPEPWHERTKAFSCLAVDLGQRDAGAFARLVVDSDINAGERPSRFIGEVDGKRWRAALNRSGLFRLPGEDAQVWRAKTDLDERNANDSGKPFDFRDELHGGRGRRARNWEADETAELMRCLEAPPEDSAYSLLPDGWRDSSTFPEQNDKLLVAMRRYHTRIARLHRWCWFLSDDEGRKDEACREIDDCDDPRLVTQELKQCMKKRDPRVLKTLEALLRERMNSAQQILVRIANRILPLRGRSWMWERHPQATEKNQLHYLTQNGPNLDSAQSPVWIRGQRGLSMKRIEQVEELRKRFQSLNQILRREIGGKPPIRRDESVPDPCPDLLEKLDNIKEQRINQTAHMILAEALGLRLAPPPPDKKKLRKEKDLHGVYEKILDKNSKWTDPADFIVIEDLSRYRATQGRAPRENSRLMKWCHRAVRDKLKQLCEVFGLPVLETPAAYSSRFCSRSGVPGFRATEVTAGFTKEGQWAWLAGKKDKEDKLTEEAQRLLDIDCLLSEAQKDLERRWVGKKCRRQCPKRTLLVPQAGGQIFVPVVNKVEGAELQPAVVQADINAAISIGLRAIADPKLWSIHPRLRTQRGGGNKPVKGKKGKLKQEATTTTITKADLLTREKRKYGEMGRTLSVNRAVNRARDAKPDDAKQPNFFADLAGLKDVADRLIKQAPRDFIWLQKEWMTASIDGSSDTPPLIHGKSFWGCVKAAQWYRINSINEARLAKWRSKEEH